MWFYAVIIVLLLLPSTAYASILLPTGSDIAAQLYWYLFIFWTSIVLCIVGFSVVIQKRMTAKSAFILAGAPLILIVLFFILPSLPGLFETPELGGTLLELLIPLLTVAGIQFTILATLLHFFYYMPGVVRAKKICIFLIAALGIAYFTPKELFQIRDQSLYFANDAPVKCTCIGIPAGEPGDLGYYCFGMPIACVETENKREPIQLNGVPDE